MTDKLPPQLLALFAPRPALRYLPPTDHAPSDRQTRPIDGIASFLPSLGSYDDNYKPTESWLQRRDRVKIEHKAAVEKNLHDGLEKYNPKDDPNARDADPFRTLFVGRLPYEMGEREVEKEFGRYGRVEQVSLLLVLPLQDQTNTCTAGVPSSRSPHKRRQPEREDKEEKSKAPGLRIRDI